NQIIEIPDGTSATTMTNSRMVRPREILAMNMPTNGDQEIHHAHSSVVQLWRNTFSASPSLGYTVNMAGRPSKKVNRVAGTRSRRNTVGPARRANTVRPTTRTIFALDNMRMPFFTPDTAEKMKITVRMVMAMMRKVSPLTSRPVTMEVPVWTWSAPMPSEVAVPKRVTRTAKVSMIRPRTRLLPPGKTGSNSDEMRGSR